LGWWSKQGDEQLNLSSTWPSTRTCAAVVDAIMIILSWRRYDRLTPPMLSRYGASAAAERARAAHRKHGMLDRLPPRR